MLRSQPSRSDKEYPQLPESNQLSPNQPNDFDIQRELNQLEEIILDSPRLFLTRRTLVDEEQLLDQLDIIRINLPTAFAEALEIVRYKEDILLQAETYAQELVETSQQRAAQILDESDIIRRAEVEASQIYYQVQHECEELKRQTLAQVEQMRQQVLQEVEDLRQLTRNECEDIQQGADDYADSVLDNLEQDLVQMLRVIRNGRQRLYGDENSKLPPSNK